MSDCGTLSRAASTLMLLPTAHQFRVASLAIQGHRKTEIEHNDVRYPWTGNCRDLFRLMSERQDEITIYGPKDDGTYLGEFRTAAGPALGVRAA